MSDDPGELDPVGRKVTTGRNKTVAEGRNKRVFWVDDERDVLIREMMSMHNGNMMSMQKGNTRWKDMAASIAKSSQLDRTADQIRGQVHTQADRQTNSSRQPAGSSRQLTVADQ